MAGLLKWVAIGLLALALPLIVVLGLLLARPEATINGLLRATADMTYVADTTTISLWPVAIDLQGAEIQSLGGESLLQLETGALRFHLWRALTGASAVWSLQADNVTVNTPKTAGASESAQATNQALTSSQAEPLDLALPLAFSRLAIDNLTIKPAEGDAISLSLSLERQQSVDETPVSAESAIESIATKITLHQPSQSDLVVEGELRYRLGSTNHFELRIPELNLNPLLEEGEASAAASGSTVMVAEPVGLSSSGGIESPVDWSWLPSLGKLDVLLKIDELHAAEHQLSAFSGLLSADAMRLQLTELAGQYQLLGADQQAIVEQAFKAKLLMSPLSLQTQGADANIDLEVIADHFQFAAKGVANVNALEGNEVAVNLGVSDFKLLRDLLNKDFAPLTPFSLAASLAGTDHSVAIGELQLSAGASTLLGSLELGLAVAPSQGLLGLSRVAASLTATQLNVQPLDDLPPRSDKSTASVTVAGTTTGDNSSGEETPSAEDSGAENVTKLFSNEPLPLEALRGFSADVSLTAEKLKILEAQFTDFSLSANSQDNALRIVPAAKFGGGGFNGLFSLTPMATSADLAVEFKLTDINLEAFELVSRDELTGGKTDLELTVNSSGASSAALAANSEGLLLLTVVDAVVQNDTFELAGSDLIMEALSKLNPFGKTDPTTELNCALVKFEGADGVWSTKNQLVVETEKMEIVGTGKIDLNDETLDIGITPSAKGGVGVNVGSLVKFLKLGGSLTNPRPQADAAGLLKSGVAIGAAASTGGLSILADGLAKRVLNAGDACVQARQPAS